MLSTFKISLLCVFFFTITKATDVTWCVSDNRQKEKCLNFAKKLTGDVKLTCEVSANCKKDIKDDKVDLTVVDADAYANLMNSHSDKYDVLAFEKYHDDDVIVAVIDADKVDEIQTLPLEFDPEDKLRYGHAALLIKHVRPNAVCGDVTPQTGVKTIKLKRYLDLKEDDKTNKKLVCVDKNDALVYKPFSDFKQCNVETNIPNAVVIKKNSTKKDDIKKMIRELGEKHGQNTLGKYGDNSHLIFRDETVDFQYEKPEPNGVTLEKFFKLHCGNVEHND